MTPRLTTLRKLAQGARRGARGAMPLAGRIRKRQDDRYSREGVMARRGDGIYQRGQLEGLGK
jgi:hypothetical protein